METATAPQSSPFLKSLASSNSHTRREALSNLRQYLRTHALFTPLDLLKLWKGLFYCMWMSDRPKAQQELARDLAGLVDVVREENVAGWIEAFWTTMSREWGGIDGLRMDKFLYLVRQYLRATFRYLSKRSWSNTPAIREHLAILSSIPLNPTDDRIPNGLRYHVLDLYVDELVHVDPERTSDMPLELLLEPVEKIKRESLAKVTRKRAEETLDDERLAEWRTSGGDDADDAHDAEIQHASPSPMQLNGARPSESELEYDDQEWGGIDEG